MSPLTRSSRTVYSRIDPGPEPSFEDYSEDTDIEMTGIEEEDVQIEEDHVMAHDPVSNFREDRIIIAIDFGTTFSSVAYTVLPKGVSPDSVHIQQVKCISNYPDYEPAPGALEFRQDVPTELWYDDCPIDDWMQRSTNRASNVRRSGSENDDSSSSDDSEEETEPSHFEDDGGLEASASTKHQNNRKSSSTQYWGYGVQHRLNRKNIPRDEARPLTRFKLNLDPKKETDEVCTEVRTILKVLKGQKIIKNGNDIYTHYLTHLLSHTKEQLKQSGELHQDMLVQFVLCVPAKWPMRACRIMQNALEGAVKEVNISTRDESSVHNIFMISEPEAAAECILAEARSEIFPGETVIILDAGGGTVDAVTYKCENEEPLRLSEEVVASDSKLCGASYINERLEKHLLKKLANETYLIDAENNVTLKSIIQSRVTVWENYQKRLIDITNRNAPIAPIQIQYLKENYRKHFEKNHLQLRRKTMYKFFDDSLVGVSEVLQNQLELAESKKRCVEKIILTGGFGQSPSLQSFLRNHLKGRKNTMKRDIDLIIPKNPSTAVARGAVLRALNKRFGPSRITECSYGLCISEPWEPDVIEAHSTTTCRINKADGERYVDETIRWVICKGQRVENMESFTFDMRHTFPFSRKELICAETLWMSDEKHPNHYRRTHAANKGAEKVGYIEANLTRIRDQGLIKPVQPSEDSTYYGTDKMYWEINYEVAMVVEGRSIRFEARWPAKKDLQPGKPQEVLAMKLVGIAAAFQPGTA